MRQEKGERFYRRLNFILTFFHITFLLSALFLLPSILPVSVAGWLLLLSVGLTANSYWALLHEAIHGQLIAQQSLNRRVGRLLAILLGSSYRLLRFGHLTHHRFNRHPMDCPDLYDPAKQSRWRAALRYYGELIFGIYLAELLLPLIFFLPRKLIIIGIHRIYGGSEPRIAAIRTLALQQFAKKRAIFEIRQDAFAHLLLLITLIFVWKESWPFLLCFYLLRGVLLSFMDNIYHFGTSISEPDYAYNLQLPRILQASIFNMNMHRVHHRHMELPWWQLPRQFERDQESFDCPFGQMALKQLGGPVPFF